jgi:hypothetical protein
MHILSPAPAANRPLALEAETARRMAEAATTFLASLTPDQQLQVMFPLEAEERLNWHYVPRERKGLSFKHMDACQRKLAFVLVSSGLSRRGFAKAVTIMGLESVLKALEGDRSSHPRDPDLYFVTIFGTPSEEGLWGWRLEGHHLSANFLIASGNRIAPAPNFFGANPAQVPCGRLAGLRVLAAEEDLARRLLTSLDEPQRQRAIFSSDAPADILTKAERRVKLDSPAGLPAVEMTEGQVGLMAALIMEYTSRMPHDVADTRTNQIEKEGRQHIHFSWAGEEEPGKPHYYRLHGPSFLVEYDNTQNNANHIHTVWRDIRGDWGDDLLERHYSRFHSSR